ncbi:MAG TPA: GNAT family N-acetyltransferase [Acidimicrobiales bacterium]|nr:GNAT family N-acetyltransferase [Acidimicrobiales bacterium]
MTFREAQADDVDVVHALVQAAFRGDASRAGWTTEADLLDGQRTDPEALAEIIVSETGALLLAEDGGEIAACCHLERRADATAYLGMLSVGPTLQGAGVGRALLAEAERRATAFGARRMRMTVIRQRTELIEWYERRGYHRTGETQPFPYGDERFGLPKVDDLEFVVLEKPLAVG